MGRKSKLGRKCSLCGERHKRELCPIIRRKLKKYDDSKNRNFFMANVLLECIHKEISFQTLLKEFSELVLEWNDFPQVETTVACLDTSIEFFAASLDCSPSKFFKNPKDTIHELIEIMSEGDGLSNPRSICYGKSGEVILTIINIPKIDNLEKGVTNHLCMYVKKYFHEGEYPDYHLYISIIKPHNIHFQNMKTCLASKLELAFEKEGELKDYFDKVYDKHWTLVAFKLSFLDSRFDVWINRLIAATRDHLVRWEKSSDYENLETNYGDVRVSLLFYSEEMVLSRLHIRIGDGRGIKFLWKEYHDWLQRVKKLETKKVVSQESDFLSDYNLILEEELEELNEPLLESNPDIKEAIKKLQDLFVLIIESKESSVDGIFEKTRTKHIEYTDTVVSSTSLICNSRTHSILPYIGIIKLLTFDNEIIDYQIYTGYCRDCDKYYIFERDYEEMLKAGTPLCNIFDKDNPQSKNNIPFRYKSQSVLNAMGYTVDKNVNLSSDKRHKILLEALQKDFFSIHDLLDFLNWLVATRKTQKKYENAIAKWNEDINFIENYKKNERKTVYISSIHKK